MGPLLRLYIWLLSFVFFCSVCLVAKFSSQVLSTKSNTDASLGNKLLMELPIYIISYSRNSRIQDNKINQTLKHPEAESGANTYPRFFYAIFDRKCHYISPSSYGCSSMQLPWEIPFFPFLSMERVVEEKDGKKRTISETLSNAPFRKDCLSSHVCLVTTQNLKWNKAKKISLLYYWSRNCYMTNLCHYTPSKSLQINTEPVIPYKAKKIYNAKLH